MEKGKLIIIEGTDCSGKETQTNLLIKKLIDDGFNCKKFSFPMYDTPTGKIVGGPYLGKSYICDGWFEEEASKVDPKVSSLYYFADRLYNIKKINDEIDNGCIVILDRYTYSNMGHQGGKELDKDKRMALYNWIDQLEFGMGNLPRGDIKVFLHMPYDAAVILKSGREEKPDQNEKSVEHLLNAEYAYVELANLYNFDSILCVKDINNISKDKIKSPSEIGEEVYEIVRKRLKH